MNKSSAVGPPTQEAKEVTSRFSHTAYYSVVLDRSANELWNVVRDFNNYPTYVNGVTESRIEDGLPGTAVGSIRDFAIGDVHTRQRLIAHSDAEKYFSYQSLGPTTIGEAGTTRTMLDYIGTLRLRTITRRRPVLRRMVLGVRPPTRGCQLLGFLVGHFPPGLAVLDARTPSQLARRLAHIRIGLRDQAGKVTPNGRPYLSTLSW